MIPPFRSGRSAPLRTTPTPEPPHSAVHRKSQSLTRTKRTMEPTPVLVVRLSLAAFESTRDAQSALNRIHKPRKPSKSHPARAISNQLPHPSLGHPFTQPPLHHPTLLFHSYPPNLDLPLPAQIRHSPGVPEKRSNKPAPTAYRYNSHSHPIHRLRTMHHIGPISPIPRLMLKHSEQWSIPPPASPRNICVHLCHLRIIPKPVRSPISPALNAPTSPIGPLPHIPRHLHPKNPAPPSFSSLSRHHA